MAGNRLMGFNTTQKHSLIVYLADELAATPATLTERGTVFKSVTKAAVATVNATDLPTAITLVNDLKTQFNDLLAKLKTAGIMAT